MSILQHETPLREPFDFDRRIGGSAGKGTHGGTVVERPPGMPTEEDCTHVVDNADDLVETIELDGVSIYLEGESGDTINLGNHSNVEVGDDVTLVGGFCDPDIPGRGVELVQPNFHRHTFKSRWGEAPTLWGISFRGPRAGEGYIDLDHKSQEFKNKTASGMWVYDDDEFVAHGCEFRGWTCAGLEIGSRGHETQAYINRCSFHDNLFEHLGYGIEHYNGKLVVEYSFFDSSRHGISGFGHKNESWSLRHCVIGPNDWCGHAMDFHGDGGYHADGRPIAGKSSRSYRCTFMSTWDIGGYAQEGIAIRGRPMKKSKHDHNHFLHNQKPNPPGDQGDAIRQEVSEGGKPWGGWERLVVKNNHYGEDTRKGHGAYLHGDVFPDKTGDDEEDNNGGDEESDKEPIVSGDILEVGGQGQPALYEITVKGRAQLLNAVEDDDKAEWNAETAKTKLHGYVGPGADKFELVGGAQVRSLKASGPVDLHLNGEELDTGKYVAASVWNMLNSDKEHAGAIGKELDEIKSRLQEMEEMKTDLEGVFNK